MVTPGGETFIDKPKSFTAHYSSDNLERAAGGIDRGDGSKTTREEQGRILRHVELKHQSVMNTSNQPDKSTKRNPPHRAGR